jgi:L-iditol 2-dehydrogenase
MRRYGERLHTVDYPIPEPEPGALVVAMDVATVCASDVHAWRGAYEGVLPTTLPVILGHEGVGRVVAIGDGAGQDSMGSSVAVGDRVVWTPEPCLSCWVCNIEKDPAACPNKSIGMFTSSETPPHFHGTFAEYSYVRPRAGRIRVPDELDSAWASAASCALRTVIKAVEKAGRIDHTDSVVIQGAGPLGLFATAIISMRHPRQLIVIGAPDERLAIAEQGGATHTVSVDEHPSAADRVQAVRRLTDLRGASVVVEVAGMPGVVSEGVEMVARKGRYLIVGSASGADQPIPAHRIVNQELTLMGSFSGGVDSYYKALDFMRSYRDRFDWDLVLGARYPLDRVTEALEVMGAHRDIKPVIVAGSVVSGRFGDDQRPDR